MKIDGQAIPVLPEELPEQSLATHPSQIYSAINSFLLCAVIWFLQPLTKRDGIAFLWAVLLYTTARFILEGIRSDEAAQFGTGLSISQNFSLVAIALCTIGLVVLYQLPAKRAWNWGTAQ